MKCSKHGENGEPLDGRCRQCLKEEVAKLVEDVVHGRPVSVHLDILRPPLGYVPTIPMGPDDFPSLGEPTADGSAVRHMRDILAVAYTNASAALQGARRFLDALHYVTVAVAFSPEDHYAWWRIHYEGATAAKDGMIDPAEWARERLSDSAIGILKTVACHIALALRHHERCSRDVREMPRDAEVRRYARGMLGEILDMRYFRLDGDRLFAVVGNGGAITDFLLPGIPEGPGV